MNHETRPRRVVHCNVAGPFEGAALDGSVVIAQGREVDHLVTRELGDRGQVKRRGSNRHVPNPAGILLDGPDVIHALTSGLGGGLVIDDSRRASLSAQSDRRGDDRHQHDQRIPHVNPSVRHP
jgi:hypothetical protein